MSPLARFQWIKDPRNPLLPPDPAFPTEDKCCMNPFVLRVDDAYRLYYSGGNQKGQNRICWATAPVKDLSKWTRHGALLDNGPAGAFDEKWCVLPTVQRIGKKWHLYYSGRNHQRDVGLQAFTGIGLATSNDGIHFEKYAGNPVVTGDQTREFPNNRGVAGGGAIVEEMMPDGSIRYRLYYTVCPGTKNKDVRMDQEKHCAVCHSTDGIRWTDHRIVMSPRRDVSFEDYAVAAPVVWKDGALYRMLYCGIGSRWGYYSIAEAVSEDGYAWHRGQGDENLSLQPGSEGAWDGQMVEYPAIIREGNFLRLFFCGNGYGSTGIGTAVAEWPAE